MDAISTSIEINCRYYECNIKGEIRDHLCPDGWDNKLEWTMNIGIIVNPDEESNDEVYDNDHHEDNSFNQI